MRVKKFGLMNYSRIFYFSVVNEDCEKFIENNEGTSVPTRNLNKVLIFLMRS